MTSTSLWLIAAFFSTGVLSFLEDGPADKLEFTSSASTIADSTDVPVTLTCSFMPSCLSNAETLDTLTLSKRSFGAGNFTLLVTVNADEVVATDDFDGATNGHVVPKGCSKSELTVIWDNPTKADRGEYRCEARGRSDSDLGKSSMQSLEIGPNPLDLVVNCMQGKPRSSLIHAKMSLIRCGASLGNWFQTLRDITQREFSDHNKYHTMFSVTELFDSRSFYFVLTGAEKFDKALSLCKKNNGYFAEINTETEFLFLANALIRPRRIQEFNYAILGAYFDSNLDNFKFYTHPEATMYLGHWAPNEPHNKPGEYMTKYDWLFLDVTGVADIRLSDGLKEAWDVGYVCEISKEIA